MASFEWEGRRMEVRSFLTGRHLWLATEEVLLVDGAAVLRSGGFRFKTRAHAALPHRGIHVKVSLLATASVKAPLGALYEVRMDDETVWTGSVTPRLAWRLPA